MGKFVFILAFVLVIEYRLTQAQTCTCVEKHECREEGSTNVIVIPTLPESPTNLDTPGFDLRVDDGCDRLETCCDEKNIVTIKPKGQQSFEYCGVRNQNGIGYRLIGNKAGVSEYGEFPWTLMLLKTQQVLEIRKDIYVCAASLIAPNLALTAAHCVVGYKDEKFYLRAGEWDTNTDKELFATQTRDVAEVLIHEEYNEFHHNNIALLKMNNPFNADINIQTICLPPANINFSGHDCITGAWGKERFEQSMLQNILRRVEVPVVPHNECQTAFRSTRLGPYFVLDDSYMCAGGEENVDVCTGDGGAPLVCAAPDGSGRYLQAGIVAWGIGCGQKGIPGAYTDVSKFTSWIRNKMVTLGVDLKTSNYYQ